MKQILFLMAILVFGVTALQAQPKREHMQKIQAIKTKYINEQLQLSAAQAQRFWPVYNRYENEVRQVRRGFFQKYRDEKGQMDRAEARRYIEDDLEYQEQILNLKKRYKDELLKIISPQQLAKLYQAERDFRSILLRQLKDNRRGS